MRNAPIGMFDSGLGGLSVMHAVRDALPGEDILYYGDCLYAPYGDRNAEYIKEPVSYTHLTLPTTSRV